MSEYIALLNGLGVPAAIGAALIITISLKKTHPKASGVGAIITLTAVAAFASIDLFPKGRDAFWTAPRIETKPEEFFASSADGNPVAASIGVYRGGTLLVEKKIVPISNDRLLARPLHLQRRADEFVALNQTVPVGVISDDSIRAAGLVQCCIGGENQSKVLHTRRVYPGDTIQLDNSSHGSLKLRFERIGRKGGAVVTLISDALGEPRPREITVENKGNDSQIFQGVHEFLVAVREADFTREHPWAAFTVVAIQ